MWGGEIGEGGAADRDWDSRRLGALLGFLY